MSTSVASVVSHFPSAENGFTTTTSGSVSSGATTVGLNSVAGYANGEIAVFVIDPSNASKQTFTGVIDTSGVQVTSVVWTAGTNTTHASGATVVDYATATHVSMITKGLLVEHLQTGIHALGSTATLTSTKVITALTDTNGNELIKVTPTASAINELTIANAAIGNNPTISATGGDTNIGITVTPKGTGNFILPEGKTAGLVRNRQGGAAGDASWGTRGTTNVDTSAKAVFIQVGSIAGNTDGAEAAVTFPEAFTQVPLVFVLSQTAASANATDLAVNAVTTTGCNIRNVGANASAESIAWMAIGQ